MSLNDQLVISYRGLTVISAIGKCLQVNGMHVIVCQHNLRQCIQAQLVINWHEKFIHVHACNPSTVPAFLLNAFVKGG